MTEISVMTTALDPLPPTFATSRSGLHRLACYVMSPARKALTGRIGLRATPGGFGTPPFGRERVVRVDGARLVVEEPRGVREASITTLAAASTFVGVGLDCDPGVGHDIPPMGEVTDPLGVEEAGALGLACWYEFGSSVLARLRSSVDPSTEPTEIQLWPEHFDAGFTAQPRREVTCNFGASPGDRYLDEPYLYVGPHDPPPPASEYWNAPFGATLAYGDLLPAGDQVAQVERGLAFLREGWARLA